MIFGSGRTLLLALLSLSVLPAAPAAAEIYKWVDAQGGVHFQDHPPAGDVADLGVTESSPVRPRELATAPPAAGAAEQAAPGKTLSEAPPAPRKTVSVELYTVSWCPWCRKAREFFRAQGVPFADYDIEKDAAAAARRVDLDPRKGVPFAVVNGVKIRGYSPEAYSRALK
jgi:glutaredoxin